MLARPRRSALTDILAATMAQANGNAQSPSDEAESAREEDRALEDIKLAIGDALHLQSQTEGGAGTRYTVKLIGYLRGKGLIVTTPTQDGKFLLMREGQNFVVRLFSGKSAYAFPATVFKVANVPYPHLHLTWPGHVKGLVVRSGARARVNLITAVTDVRGNARSGLIDNLSTGGCSLASKELVGRSEDRIHMTFRANVNEIEQYFQLDGVVRSVQRDVEIPGGTGNQHGIQFVDMPPQDQLALTAYVYHVLFEETA
ncbi:pilus assembly protein PilZ [Pseudazoarcus pumilus]|uniref:Pilus assembly protein PilZ n=2 Tax=Pseudazoarcus pumilus TaxID=2067960 RepID=A0A2I6S9M3_9RHOO|nr:pilus assembly protein PilZ [Pseudazoarcus pumilus]